MPEMPDDPNSPEAARAVVAGFFHLLGAGSDVDGWLELIHDDIEVDTPFSPTGEAVRFEGKEAIERRFGDARRRMPEFSFFDVDILATEDPDRWVATCRSEGVAGSGARYTNIYCWIFRLRDGRIVHWTEYFDPQQVLASRTK
jgi:ketosteroid isomerase-like protein